MNDYASTADLIAANVDYYGRCHDGDDCDWFVVTVPENGHITLQFDHELFADSDEYWCMTLCDEGGEIGCWSISGSENTKTEQIALSAGTYYIKIEPYASYRYDMSRYILCVDFTTVP